MRQERRSCGLPREVLAFGKMERMAEEEKLLGRGASMMIARLYACVGLQRVWKQELGFFCILWRQK